MFLQTQTRRLLRDTSRVAAAGMLALSVWPSGAALRREPPSKPAYRLPLSSLGFPGYAPVLLHRGFSLSTVHLLDDSHLLFTYSMRSLVPRIPGDDVNDDDRLVAAVLVQLPTGKVLARTEWHLHDHRRYLWSVGRGVFVLRMGDEISLLAPLRGLTVGDAFRRYALPHPSGKPAAVSGSPDGQIITLQVQQDGPEETLGDTDVPKPKRVTIEFFRVLPDPDPAAPAKIMGAGLVGSPMALHLPLDGDGYLWAEDGNRGKWNISFNEFQGKPQKITSVLSSCPPRMELLSRSEFLVTTCRGSDDSAVLSAYGFDGHENWEEPFGQTLEPPRFVSAPQAGRFGMSRLIASSGGAGVSGLDVGDPLSQEIRVYQVGSGDLLLRLQCIPAVRTAENFDLSPDGTTLAVLGNDTLDIYRLPELSARDRKDLADAESMTPPAATGPVELTRITRPIDAAEAPDRAEAPAPAAQPASAPVSTAAATANTAPTLKTRPAIPDQGSAAPASAAEEDVSSPAPRKPPTLLKPGEKPEFKTPDSSPR